MPRHFIVIAIVIALTAASFSAKTSAEIAYESVPGDLTSTVIKMTVTPAAEPVPAFKHRFVPEDITLKSGNAAPYYYRALLDLPRRMKELRDTFKDPDEELLDKWYSTDAEATPIEKLPVEKLRAAEVIAIGGWVADQLTEATQRRNCDFELGLSELQGIESIFISLEEFQRSRELCRMLALRTRLAIAEKRHDDAIEAMRMNYRLAKNFGSLPFIVSGLIGIAEAGVTNGTALELIAQPGSPNLYWAFSELPDPMINMREAARFELDFGPRLFPVLHQTETTDRSYDEWNRLLRQVFRDLAISGSELQLFGDEPLFGHGDFLKSEAGAGVLATASGLLGYTHAKARLIADGMDRERVEKMPVGQVMAIYTERNYQKFADEWETLWYMPYWELQGRTEAMEDRIAKARLGSGGADREVIPMVSLLLPAMEAARNAQVRLEREIASLRVIEAMRIYAAANSGQLPRSLDNITQVPVPINPATGKDFVYYVRGATAILELPASDGIGGGNRRYEIQIAKQ
jgi:hypothetical protein